MSEFALIAGWVCLVVGAVMVVGALVWAASELSFRTLKSVVGWPWLYRAMKHYSEIEKPPRFVTGEDTTP